MPSVDELNAGFDVANDKVHGYIAKLLPDQTIPFVGNLRQIASQKLESPEGRQFLLDEVKAIALAMEAVRAKS